MSSQINVTTAMNNARAGDTTDADEGGVRQRQSDEARRVLLEATTACLDKFGYADTSIARIQAQANVSRGALTHHFPSKELLMVATIDHLLESLLRPSLPSKNLSQTDIIADLRWLARNMTGTPKGRALSEVLLATRTDKKLQNRVGSRLRDWNAMLDEAVVAFYASPHGDDDDVRQIWMIARTFMRGLILQQPFTPDPNEIDRAINRFGRLIAPYLETRQRTGESHDKPV
jgi:AcrR family transcriptional regulator